jgi:hypothetical protein
MGSRPNGNLLIEETIIDTDNACGIILDIMLLERRVLSTKCAAAIYIASNKVITPGKHLS